MTYNSSGQQFTNANNLVVVIIKISNGFIVQQPFHFGEIVGESGRVDGLMG
jgi:hypothetical protein